MSHDKARREMLAHGEPAEDRLGHHAQRKDHRQQGQIAPEGTSCEGQDGRDHRQHPDDG